MLSSGNLSGGLSILNPASGGSDHVSSARPSPSAFIATDHSGNLEKLGTVGEEDEERDEFGTVESETKAYTYDTETDFEDAESYLQVEEEPLDQPHHITQRNLSE
jgi:hypothetical protein